MRLDPITLLFTSALVIAFSGLLLAAAHRPGKRSSSLAIWGAAMVVGAIGLVLTAIGDIVAGLPSRAADLGGTTLVLFATALSWTAARTFRERPPILLLILAGPLFWLLTSPLQLMAPHATSPAWAALASGIGATYTAATALELWRTRPERLPSRLPALILLGVHCAIYLIRAALLLFEGRPALEIVANAMVMESLLHTNGMAFLLLAMVKERLELRSTEQLRALTRLDGLTGIGNRRHFDEQLDAEIRRARRCGPTLALLLIDVDHFKAYNDAVGHQRGDACLREVAKTIAHQVHRPGDLAARYGGEEFAVVMASTDRDGAIAQAERMRAAIEAMGIRHPGIGGVVTISVGVATFTPDAVPSTAVDLVGKADRALYEAKASGRNTVRAAWATTQERIDSTTH